MPAVCKVNFSTGVSRANRTAGEAGVAAALRQAECRYPTGYLNMGGTAEDPSHSMIHAMGLFWIFLWLPVKPARQGTGQGVPGV